MSTCGMYCVTLLYSCRHMQCSSTRSTEPSPSRSTEGYSRAASASTRNLPTRLSARALSLAIRLCIHSGPEPSSRRMRLNTYCAPTATRHIADDM